MKIKTDIERYAANQIYLLKNGTYAWISSVAPESKLNSTKDSRMVEYLEGRVAEKGKLDFDSYTINVNVDGITVTFSIKKRRKTSIELLDLISFYVGYPNEKKMRERQEALNLYYNETDTY